MFLKASIGYLLEITIEICLEIFQFLDIFQCYSWFLAWQIVLANYKPVVEFPDLEISPPTHTSQGHTATAASAMWTSWGRMQRRTLKDTGGRKRMAIATSELLCEWPHLHFRGLASISPGFLGEKRTLLHGEVELAAASKCSEILRRFLMKRKRSQQRQKTVCTNPEHHWVRDLMAAVDARVAKQN